MKMGRTFVVSKVAIFLVAASLATACEGPDSSIEGPTTSELASAQVIKGMKITSFQYYDTGLANPGANIKIRYTSIGVGDGVKRESSEETGCLPKNWVGRVFCAKFPNGKEILGYSKRENPLDPNSKESYTILDGNWQPNYKNCKLVSVVADDCH